MSFLTDKKTLIVGALSLISSVSAVILTNQQSSAVPFFTQSGTTAQIIASQNQVSQERSYILQGLAPDALVAAVESVGARVAREFPVINAVSAYLTTTQVNQLTTNAGVRVTFDRSVRTMNAVANPAGTSLSAQATKYAIDNHITTQTGADQLHQYGITGRGVTVAVLDSGTLMGGQIGQHLLRDSLGRARAFVKYDATTSRRSRNLNDDLNGHGTHVTGIIASSLKSENGKYNGMAPDAYLMSIKAFDAQGNGSYTDVLDGLNWIFQNRNRYRIRVLNLSLGADVQSSYWNDPINQAVMRLWQAGVVVVTSAGNTGSENGTVTVPGNNPYIVTVGAITDSFTPDTAGDDRLTTFSSRGPTFEGFVKPEIVAFGGHISTKMNKSLLVNKNYVASSTGEDYHMVSGTSQASAVVAGTVALMLDHNPSLSPDDVKCRLIASAQVVADPGTGADYSPFAQGAGLINAFAAVNSNAYGCANQGLNVSADLNGVEHFAGPTKLTSDGHFTVNLNGTLVKSENSISSLANPAWATMARTTLEGGLWGTTLEGGLWGTTLEGGLWGSTLEGGLWGSTLEGGLWGTTLEGGLWGNLSVESLAVLSSDTVEGVIPASEPVVTEQSGVLIEAELDY